MTELGLVAWPPAPIKTERLVLREPEAGDRAAVIELFASPEVGFTEVERFEEYGAEQWFGVWSAVTPSG
jgi:hypothetical protein